MPFLDVQGLSKSYRMGGRTLAVLRGLELAVEPGEMVAIVGASESARVLCYTFSGASTVLRRVAFTPTGWS